MRLVMVAALHPPPMHVSSLTQAALLVFWPRTVSPAFSSLLLLLKAAEVLCFSCRDRRHDLVIVAQLLWPSGLEYAGGV